MLKIAKWKLLAVAMIIVLSVYFALPSLFDTTSTKWLPNKKISYGLDLKGGVSITILVDLDHDVKEKLSFVAQQFKEQLLLTKTKISNVKVADKYFSFEYADGVKHADFKSYPLQEQLYCEKSASGLRCKLRRKNSAELERTALKQSIEIIRKRILG